MRISTLALLYCVCSVSIAQENLHNFHITSAPVEQGSSAIASDSNALAVAMARLRDAEAANTLSAEGRMRYNSDSNKKSIADYKYQSYSLVERGDFRDAIRAASIYLFLGLEQKNEGHVAYAKLLLATAYLYSGKLQLANQYAAEVLSHWVWPQWRNNAYGTANKILGDVALRRGEYSKAISYYEKSIDLADDFLRFYSRLALASAHISAGHYTKANQAIDHAEGYIETLGKVGQLSAKSLLLRARGILALKSGRLDDADSLYKTALETHGEGYDSAYDRFWLLEGIAKTKLAKGDKGGAAKVYLEAILEAENVRARFRSEEIKSALFGEMQDAFDMAVQLLIESGHPDIAWEVSERSRSRALLDMMRNRVKLSSGNDAFSDAAKVTSKISTLSEKLSTNDVVISYHMLSEYTYGWAIRKSGTTMARVGSDRQTIAQLVEDFRDAVVMRRKGAKQYGAELYDILIKPFKVTEGETITFVPHDAIHYLPFQALWVGDKYLIQRNSVSYAPSGTSLVMLFGRQDNKKGIFLGLGNPDLGDPAMALPGAQRELESLRVMFPNAEAYFQKDATRDKLLQRVGDSRILHIAAHGTVDRVDPLLSKIHLAGNSAIAGVLEARDVYSMRLKNTALVTLSACETGLGKVSRGDEIWGFARSFLSAGAQSLIVSLWPVSDESTETLMKRFYLELNNGSDARDSLRSATLEVMNDRRFSDPYFWAPFILMGKMH